VGSDVMQGTESEESKEFADFRFGWVPAITRLTSLLSVPSHCVLVVGTNLHLLYEGNREPPSFAALQSLFQGWGAEYVEVSTETGDGINLLRQALLSAMHTDVRERLAEL
jgi:hypothetical protein